MSRKSKLQQFEENTNFGHVIQPTFEEAFNEDHVLKGNWKKSIFKNNNPIVLELGCGKGEYTVGLAERTLNKNFIGIDIKGARIWRGAKLVGEKGLTNATFLRTKIDFLPNFFAPNEVDEIWLTFSDPQSKKPGKRLSSEPFLERYLQLLKPGGYIHLKTDSRLLYNSTMDVCNKLGLEVETHSHDIYQSDWDKLSAIEKKDLEIKTFYEKTWLDQGFRINYCRFKLHDYRKK
ncbi:MAG: tRNA (guanine-N7-)-methyltransferase [Sphingobacteriales bacterium]